MIVSVSRRTDIPAHYSDWFFNRLKEGFALVRNPFNSHLISKVLLRPENVDCFVFWTRNPQAFLPRLDELKDYHYCFQFTLNPYGRDVEPGVPDKTEAISLFRRLSEVIGPDRLIWRYDPVIITPEYDVRFHVRYFRELCASLSGHTSRCVFSYYDDYKFAARNSSMLGLMPITDQIILETAESFAESARQHKIILATCAEKADLSRFGIMHGRCIDGELISRITGRRITAKSDKNQRRYCGCAASVDIGAYSTCTGGCRYCYATRSHQAACVAAASHDPASPLLTGRMTPQSRVYLRL